MKASDISHNSETHVLNDWHCKIHSFTTSALYLSCLHFNSVRTLLLVNYVERLHCIRGQYSKGIFISPLLFNRWTSLFMMLRSAALDKLTHWKFSLQTQSPVSLQNVRIGCQAAVIRYLRRASKHSNVEEGGTKQTKKNKVKNKTKRKR